MNTSIQELYDKVGVPPAARDYFWSEVRIFLTSYQDKQKLIYDVLLYLATCYVSGGISCNRSLRSQVLDKIRNDIELGDTEHAKKMITILIAMYHNHDHIRKYNWHDFKLEFLYESRIDHRVKLTAVAHLLSIENKIPDISNFKHEDFLEFLK